MINIVKIGGNVINDREHLEKFLCLFLSMPGKKILVHGGGKEASEFGRKLGFEPKMIEGRRVTDKNTLDLVTMIYAGLINKRIVALLQSKNCDAVGLCGADGDAIPASKRNPLPIDFGFVGDIKPEDINISFISELLENEKTPVFCAICHDKKGTLLNCNADTIASSLACALAAKGPVNLIYCFEKPGVLLDCENPESVIPVITTSNFSDLKEKGVITAGMVPKLQNAVDAVIKGVESVKICLDSDLISEKGTKIVK